jgi:MFS transporter, AAHS family, 4-hydroxybenzoate transporter
MTASLASVSHAVRTEAVDVAEFIDRQPFSPFQTRLLLLCATVLFIDGFDTQSIGFVAPAIARDWHLPRSVLGPVFSAGLFGLMLSAFILGPVADRIGRRPIIIFSTFTFGVGSLLTVFAQDVYWLIALRFLTGLGIGGAMPNVVALIGEFSPHRRRATAVMLSLVGFSAGSVFGGLLAAALLPDFGWRSVFFIGGVFPILFAPVLMRIMPESVRFLALTGRAPGEIAKLLRRISASANFAAGTRFYLSEPKLPGIPVLHLFDASRAVATLLIWVVFFTNMLDIYLLATWLPSVLNDFGMSISVAAAVGATLQAGGIIGNLTLGQLIDRFAFLGLSVTYCIAAIAVIALGFSMHAIVLVVIATFCTGFCIVGGQIASNALTVRYYPTMMRATGIGWALGIGRIGAIAGPLMGGIILSRHVQEEMLFMVAAIPALIACAATFLLAVNRTGRPGT